METLAESLVLDELKCQNCKNLAIDPRECDQCNNLICLECTKLQSQVCLICQAEKFALLENHFVQRLIDKQQTDCPNQCGQKSLLIGELKDHKKACSLQKLHCQVPECKFAGIKNQFNEHLFSQHDKELLKNFTFQWNEGTVDSQKWNPLKEYQNDVGSIVRMGSNGYYYCGKQANINCGGCDGNCGPTGGCTCAPCMKFNLQIMGVPKGFLINHNGAVCSVSKDKNQVFCGRKFSGSQYNFGGSVYCTPASNQSCDGCRKTQKLLSQTHFLNLL